MSLWCRANDSDESDYSDVECDVDVDATLKYLITAPNQLDLISQDDEEIAPIITQKASLKSVMDLLSSGVQGKSLTLESLASMASASSKTPVSLLDIGQVYSWRTA
ncbi:camkk camkk-meta protein kinase [Plasmopara halstedii]|uniref:Camkk camkk-meta protein kinase n=1 Tax=Plasmopara halstedii TaxID=4781 RepID=A0A0P1AGJ2_PLAHL|nr:camkk camkk-meta protein kinase [Plasmopara halstedii]CEG39780.1 camkk camkk-meta protein kinase [Plasmopara halstedii]|eukprot:XP_024576149.1 camkk camkk-meta protein kinase [Plasmopara halstedii]